MSRYFDGEMTATKLEIKASELRPGDMVSGEIVNFTETDIGMVVAYYKSGNYGMFHKNDRVRIVRRNV